MDEEGSWVLLAVKPTKGKAKGTGKGKGKAPIDVSEMGSPERRALLAQLQAMQ